MVAIFTKIVATISFQNSTHVPIIYCVHYFYKENFLKFEKSNQYLK